MAFVRTFHATQGAMGGITPQPRALGPEGPFGYRDPHNYTLAPMGPSRVWDGQGREMPEEAEMTWEDGSQAEYCLDNVGDHFDPNESLGWLLSGMGFFLFIGLMTSTYHSQTPVAKRDMPFGGLAVELGKKAADEE